MKSLLSLQIASLLVISFSFCCTPLLAESEQKKKRFNPNPYANSYILTSGDTYTIIPTTSVLHFPERHKQRISSKPQGKFLFFREFKAKNFAWISTFAVTLEQSRGSQPLSEEKLEFLKESGKVIIAYRGNGAVPVLTK